MSSIRKSLFKDVKEILILILFLFLFYSNYCRLILNS